MSSESLRSWCLPITGTNILSVIRVVQETATKWAFVFNRPRTEIMPEYLYIPQWVVKSSREHAIFLYFATLLDFRWNSGNMFPYVKNIFDENPDLFYNGWLIRKWDDWEYILAEQAIEALLQWLPNAHQWAHSWHIAWRTLFEIYDWDPGRILQIPNLITTVRNRWPTKSRLWLTGWWPKLISLLVKHYVKFWIIPYNKELLKDFYPVDLHTLQLLMNTWAIKIEWVTDGARLAEKIRQQITEIMYLGDMNPTDISELMWMFWKYWCGSCKRKNTKNAECPFFQPCDWPINMSEYHFTGNLQT